MVSQFKAELLRRLIRLKQYSSRVADYSNFSGIHLLHSTDGRTINDLERATLAQQCLSLFGSDNVDFVTEVGEFLDLASVGQGFDLLRFPSLS